MGFYVSYSIAECPVKFVGNNAFDVRSTRFVIVQNFVDDRRLKTRNDFGIQIFNELRDAYEEATAFSADADILKQIVMLWEKFSDFEILPIRRGKEKTLRSSFLLLLFHLPLVLL